MGERVLVFAGLVLGAVAVLLGALRIAAGGPGALDVALCLLGALCAALALSLLPGLDGWRRR